MGQVTKPTPVRYRGAMSKERDVYAGRAAFLRHFEWVDGHAGMWSVFEDPIAFGEIISALAALACEGRPTRVVAIESRGFLLGAAVARDLRLGVQAIRKPGGILPGPKLHVTSAPDYRKKAHDLRMRATLDPSDRVVLVDDWVERGSQARAARTLVERTGATWAGTVSIVDDADEDTRVAIGPLLSLLRRSDLPPDHTA